MKDYNYNANTNQSSFGQFGLRVLTTNATTGEEFVAIQVLTDAVISATLTANQSTGEIGDTSITSLSLTAGTIIYGRFINLQVASGKLIAYKG